MTKLYDYAKMHFQKEAGILAIGSVFQQLVTLTTPVLEAGNYRLAFAWQADFHGQKNQPFESQLTGDYVGDIYSDSIGDNDGQIKNHHYAFIIVHAGGPLTLGMQGRKGPSFTAQLDVNFIDIMIDRVG